MTKTALQSEKERREYSRLEISIPVHYAFRKSGRLVKITASTGNIGGGGVCLKLEESIPPLTHLELQIKLPSGLYPIVIQGKVVWCEKMSSSSEYIAGIAFHGVNERDRREVIDYVRKMLK